jgi:hypothetical protein
MKVKFTTAMKYCLKLMLAGLALVALNLQVHAQVAFTLAGNYVLGTNYISATAADINGDGQKDLILVNNGILILTNNGNGQFGSNAMLTANPAATFPEQVTAADINGDGKLDLIWSDGSVSGHILVFTNNGSGGFGSNATLIVGSNPASFIAADVNGDGRPDLICVNEGTGTLSILTNNGSGVFGSNATIIVGSNYPTLAADVNQDGKPDLICVDEGMQSDFMYVTSSTLSVFVNVPTLTSIFSSNNLTVSWPSSWTNWMLLQNPDLTTTNWTASTGTGNDGTNESLTVSVPTDSLFFRLVHP